MGYADFYVSGPPGSYLNTTYPSGSYPVAGVSADFTVTYTYQTTYSQKSFGDCSCGAPGAAPAGDPIDLGGGNVYEQITDYSTAGSNPLSFTRYYNSYQTSGLTFASMLGSNWRSTYDRYLRIGASALTAERADGKMLSFTQSAGVWTSDTDVDIKITQTGSTYTLTDANDTVETYAAVNAGEAVLSSIRLRNGYLQTMNHNSSNQLTSVVDSYNRTLNLTYAGSLLGTVTTPDGVVVSYGYASSGVTLSLLDQLSKVSYNTSPVTSQSYIYDNNYPYVNPPFALTGIVDENGNRFATWAYDSSGRGTSSQHAGGADLTTISYNFDGSRTMTGPLGVQHVYHFTTLQGVPKLTEVDRIATSTTAAAQQLFTYDGNGYLATRTDWNGNLTTFVNDSHGQPLATVEASGTAQARTTTVTYHPTFRLPVKIVEPGLTTDLVYDSSGNLLTKTLTDTTTATTPYSTSGSTRVWSYAWANGLLTSVKGPRTDASQLTSFSYDGLGTMVQTTNALTQTTQVTQHTTGGLPLTVVDANGVTTKLTYDARLRLTATALSTSAGTLTTNYGYDAAGNLLSVTQPDGSMLTNTYDAAHRLTGIKDLLNQTTQYTLDAQGDRTAVSIANASAAQQRKHSATFDALGRTLTDVGGVGQTTTMLYDSNGNATSVKNPLGRVTAQAFDALNRRAKVTDAAGGTTSTTYDAYDRPLSVMDPNGNVTSYVYDGFGDVIEVSSPDSGKTVYRYDAAGNLVNKVDAAGAITNYAYDALDRVTAVDYPGKDASQNVLYTYDQASAGFGAGRLTRVRDAAGTLSRAYDERGNVVSEKRVLTGATLQTSYSWDTANRLASVGYPSGWMAFYGRDTMGRVTGITAKAPAASNQVLLSGIGYQPFGPVNGLTFGNGVAETRSFDLDYRMTALNDVGISAVQKLSYGYDGANNVLSIADGVAAANSQTLGYDTLDRLTTAAGGYGSLAYTYDAVGNRLTQTSGTTNTTYKYVLKSNRVASVITGAVTQGFGYTAAGNINQVGSVGSRPSVYTYNEAGRLATVEPAGQPSAAYTYDAFGHRLVKRSSATRLYQYDLGGHLLEETDNQGHGMVDYVYLGDRPVATLSPPDGKVYFLHDDRLETPQVATDAGQVVQWSANYQPFGGTSTGVGVIAQNLRLPGQEYDSETGFYHNGFRDYAPGLGRYLESDPVGLWGTPIRLRMHEAVLLTELTRPGWRT